MPKEKPNKKSITLELVIGSGVFLVSLPFVLFVLFFVGIILLGAILAIGVNIDPAVVIALAIIGGGSLLIFLGFLWQFFSRFRLLLRRWRGLRVENRRVSESIDTSVLALDSSDNEDVSSQYDEEVPRLSTSQTE